MKNKILITVSLILILVFGFLYTQKNILIADDKDGKKDCSSSCTQKTSSSINKSQCTEGTKMSGAVVNDDKGLAVYEFVTDKIHCDACKPGVSEKLMGIAGVKDVNYDASNTDTHLTNVKVYYSASDTTPEIIAASVKENSLCSTKDSCGDGSKCTGKTKTEKKL
ncbi:MAG: hypothetical protein ABI462_11040 [Ignavibacteria bacterium]